MDRLNWVERSGGRSCVASVGYHDRSRIEDALVIARGSAWLAVQPAAFVEKLLTNALLRQYRRGQVIIRLDQKDQGLHFLLEGAADVWVPRLTGELIPVHLVSPLGWFGEYAALTGKTGFAEYCARVETTALVIPRSAIVALELENPIYRDVFLELLAHSVRSLLWMSGDLAGLDPVKRVISKLLTLAGANGSDNERRECVINMSQAELSVACCVSRPTMNLILGKLEKMELVKPGYRRIVVLERQGLLAALKEER